MRRPRRNRLGVIAGHSLHGLGNLFPTSRRSGRREPSLTARVFVLEVAPQLVGAPRSPGERRPTRRPRRRHRPGGVEPRRCRCRRAPPAASPAGGRAAPRGGQGGGPGRSPRGAAGGRGVGSLRRGRRGEPSPPGGARPRSARAAARPRPRSRGQLRPVPRHRPGPGMARRRPRGPSPHRRRVGPRSAFRGRIRRIARGCRPFPPPPGRSIWAPWSDTAGASASLDAPAPASRRADRRASRGEP